MRSFVSQRASRVGERAFQNPVRGRALAGFLKFVEILSVCTVTELVA